MEGTRTSPVSVRSHRTMLSHHRGVEWEGHLTETMRENWLAMKQSFKNTFTPVTKKNKKQKKRLQVRASGVFPPGISIKNRFTALDFLKNRAPATSQGEQEKFRNKQRRVGIPPQWMKRQHPEIVKKKGKIQESESET